jgi:hypothetical protein
VTDTLPDTELLTRVVEVIQNLPALMKEHRAALGIGTHRAAAQCGMYQQVYWRLEAGLTTQPAFHTVIKVLRWLGAEVPDFECTCLFFKDRHERRCPNRGLRPAKETS